MRNFRFFFVGQLVSMTGQWMQTVALALLVLHLSGSGLALGLVTLLQYLPLLLLGPFAGAIIERVPKRRVLLVSQGLQGLVATGLVVFGAADALTLPVAMTAAGLFGIIQPFDNPSRRTFLYEMVGPDRLTNAVALNAAVMTTARLVGPMLAGLLITAAGPVWCFLANAASFVAILAVLAVMRSSEMHLDRPVAPAGADSVVAGLKYAASHRDVWWPLLMTAALALLLQNYSVLVPLLATRSLRQGPAAVGLLFGALGVGSVLMTIVVAKVARTGFRLVAGAAVAFGSVAVVTSLSPSLAIMLGALVLLGAADQAFSQTANSTLQLTTSPAYRTRVMALFSAFFTGMQGVSGLYVGSLSDVIGPRRALLAGGVFAILVGGYAAWSSRRHRQRRFPLVD